MGRKSSDRQLKKKKQSGLIRALTLKEAIEALAIYNIEHCRFPHNYFAETGDFGDIPELHGLVLDDRRLILIDKEQGIEEIKESVIHELIHAKHFMKGDLPSNIKTIERRVIAETTLTYSKLFGEPP